MITSEWSAEVVEEAEKIIVGGEEGLRPDTDFCIRSPIGDEYGVGKLLGKSGRFNLYECVPKNGQSAILKIAAETEHNGALDREAFVLSLMATGAAELEAKNTEEKRLNYAYFFPELIESFIAENQDGRRINILGFPEEIKTLGQMTTISALTEIERVRVDPRTGAWILGKMLKVLKFNHEQGISNELIVGSNILIERDLHGLIVFDWTLISLYYDEGAVPPNLAREDLSHAGYAATVVLGGDPETGELPADEQLVDKRFEEFLRKLTCGGLADAGQAHQDFYKLIWSLWPRQFHPFTTYNL